jgi:antitoxin component YwqK of YwqJK toxin-antitoxin module
MRSIGPNSFTVLIILLLLNVSAPAFTQPQPSDGRYRSLHKNGKTEETGYYKNGLKYGMWYQYNDQGVVLRKQKWKKGELHWQVEYENGRRARITNSKGNVRVLPACSCN